MSEEERAFEKKKRNLILKLMDDNFEQRIYESLTSGDFKSIEEVDAYVDKEFKEHLSNREAILNYYTSKLYS